VGDGDIIGVDADPAMVAEARRRMAAHPNVTVQHGDAHALPLPDASVDRVRMDRVVQHLTRPATAFTEAARVLRTGGTLVVAEPDWDTLVIDDPDIDTSRAYTRFVTHDVVRNGPIGRQLPRLAVDAGLRVHAVIAIPVLFNTFQAATTILRLETVMNQAVAAGAFDTAAATGWAARLRTGPFLAAFTLFIIAAHRPA
jgi:SAM-dependent methyltransferase